MKTATHPRRGLLSQGSKLLAMLSCVAVLVCPRMAVAESVDTELLLLVDVSNGGLKKDEFSSLMNGYADALTSSQVIDSIQSGTVGRIAVSLMYFGGDPLQPTAVAWMSIGSLAEAQAFANQLRVLPEPTNGNFRYADALTQAVAAFGTETGAPTGNGFESAVQIIEVAGASRPNGNSADIDAATVAAFASGVDLIGATAIGKKIDQVESYYVTHVVGGTVGGVTGTVTTNDLTAGIELTLSNQLATGISGAAAVPEPSAAILFLSSMAFYCLFMRRR